MFVLDILVAILLAMATVNLHAVGTKYFKFEFLASIFVTLTVTLALFVPIVYFAVKVAMYIPTIDPKVFQTLETEILKSLSYLPDQLDFVKAHAVQFLAENQVSQIVADNVKGLGAFLGKSVNFIKDIALILIFLFFLHLYGKPLMQALRELSPLDDNSNNVLFYETSSVMSITIYSIVLNAGFQGLLFGVFISQWGYDLLFFMLAYAFASLIPIIGGLLLWLPISLHQFYLGETNVAIAIAAYSVIVISVLADTFVKPFIIDMVNRNFLETPAKVNSLVIFFAMIAGLSSMGFWGIILGPAATTLFVSTLKVYKKIQSYNDKPYYFM